MKQQSASMGKRPGSGRLLPTLLLVIGAATVADAQKLVRADEEVVYAFRTGGGRKAVVVRDTAATYLAYRYGTEAKVELQYPQVLDSSSFSKFSYSGIIRGESFDGTGALDLSFLVFYNGGYRYIVYHMIYESADFSTGIKVEDTTTGKITRIHGQYKTRRGDLSAIRWDERVNQGEGTYED